MDSAPHRRVLVTVGSTGFDQLVNTVLQHSFHALLLSLGYTHLIVQHGSSNFPAEALTGSSDLRIDAFPYKPSLLEDMQSVDLIISHAGSGSILEALRLEKPLIVVINETLMNNHQQELGDALQEQGYLVSCTPTTLKRFPAADPAIFASYLDSKLFV
ncbi:N-acetylglucosaminyldiphosphodolichol N-acetylglucosaminyltransferase catalytic subunit alg13 [Actinomortierella ambigua]|nr:N-acetylglucosaminyldiphosphodolichol N-acetylglucosaminyltransferase catalytic subunit alg13 [Actinomortierella ambigua]